MLTPVYISQRVRERLPALIQRPIGTFVWVSQQKIEPVHQNIRCEPQALAIN